LHSDKSRVNRPAFFLMRKIFRDRFAFSLAPVQVSGGLEAEATPCNVGIQKEKHENQIERQSRWVKPEPQSDRSS
jgi:hypothetical protein